MAARILFCILLALSTTSCFHRQLDPTVGLRPSTPHEQTPWTTGNRIITLKNGDGFYPPMLQAIRDAKKSVTFETFAYVPGNIANAFTTALCLKAQQGIPVHLILDGIGSAALDEQHLTPLRQSGVQIHLYHPVTPTNIILLKRLNNRTHRKILITDGTLAFTGGAGFADAWSENAQDPTRWRDTQYQIQGPAVAQLQRTFTTHWKKLTRHTLTGPRYFPTLTPQGNLRAAFIPDSPQDHTHPIAHSILHTINTAQKELLIQNSYFVPNPTIKKALIRAAHRGVQITLILPGEHIDSKPTRHASQYHWPALLRAGIRIHQFQPTMMHAKLLIADRQLTIIGSANLDDRSFFINHEVNLHVHSTPFALTQLRMFNNDLKRTIQITPQNIHLHRAPLIKRLTGRLIQQQL